MSLLSALRRKGIMAFLLLVGPSCRGITVQGGEEDTSGEGSTGEGSTSGATTSTSSGSGGGGQGASNSGAGGSVVDAGSNPGPSGYPDGGSPIPGTQFLCWSGDPCPADEFCQYNPNSNCGNVAPGIDPQGFCMKRPDTCTADCPGACGCNDKWYCNDCLANAAGVSTGKVTCQDGGAP